MDDKSIILGPKTKNGIARCVWERRMKCDQVKGGIKLFKGEEDDEISSNNDEKITVEEVHVVDKKENSIIMSPKQQKVVVGTTNGGGGGKRKTWKSEGSPIQLARQRSEMGKNLEEKITPIQIRKTRSDKSMKKEMMSVVSLQVLEKSPVQNKETRSESKSLELRKSIKVLENGESCNGQLSNGAEEKIENTSNVVQVKSTPPKGVEEEEEKIEENLEIEKKSLVVKEISNVAENKKFQTIVKKKTPPFASQTHTKLVHLPSPSKTNPSLDETQRAPRKHTKLQSFFDLVMWRDVSKSALVFGIGAFSIISSSYTKDLNISFISVISYLGLVYLAAIFLFRSFISRGSEMNDDDSSINNVFGEEEAVWLVKLSLPFVNECFLNLKALFSGDPATTMKMAGMLFVLARCGSSITIWKMAKLSFFGVFTVPKICSSYSTQLNEYGICWIRRFRDAWESCTHKKAVAFAIFTLVWKLSSSIVRIWAVFMLFVAFRYYQQSIYVEESWAKEEKDSTQRTSRVGPAQRQPRRPILMETGKQKRIY